MKNKLIERKVAQARIHNHKMIQARSREDEASYQINEMLRNRSMSEARKLKEEANAN